MLLFVLWSQRVMVYTGNFGDRRIRKSVLGSYHTEKYNNGRNEISQYPQFGRHVHGKEKDVRRWKIVFDAEGILK